MSTHIKQASECRADKLSNLGWYSLQVSHHAAQKHITSVISPQASRWVSAGVSGKKQVISAQGKMIVYDSRDSSAFN
jgi:hypothetical protein